MDPTRATANCGNGRRGTKPKVVVTVPVDRRLFANPFADPAHKKLGSFGCADADSVNDDYLFRARVHRSRVDVLHELEVGTRPVHAEERDANVILRSVSDCLRRAPHRLVARDAIGLKLDLADRCLNHRCSQAKSNEFFNIAECRSRKAPNLRVLQIRLQDQRDGFTVFFRHLGEARFDPSNTQFIELLCNLEFLLRTEDDPDRLLPVTQSRVIETHRPRAIEAPTDVRARVQLAGPHLTGEIIHRGVPCSSLLSCGAFLPYACSHEITGLRRMPICSISHSITSPGLRNHAFGSALNAATPETVPVDTTSPAL